MGVSIHPQSIVADGAKLGDNVEIGPFCTVGPDVKLGDGVKLVSHVSITGDTEVGPRTIAYPFVALGHPPQDLKFKGEKTRVIIGSDNTLRENVTIHCGTLTGRSQTVVGDHCFMMAGSHVGHDCIIGNRVTFANGAVVGGAVVIEDFAILGGLCAVHQLGRIGKYAFIGGGAALTGDVIPFGMVDNHGRLHGLNLVGLKRRGFKRETINTLRAVYRMLFEDAGNFRDKVAAVAKAYGQVPEVAMILDFINAGQKRPLCIPREL